ncbi:MAG TPA: YciI family protein [Bacteroidia bacterium]|nr:YciI family protein [Bacteroidia bacterium]
MKDGDKTITMKQYVFCMLMKGENRTQDSLQSAAIQKGHLAYMDSLANLDIIHIAGPFGEDMNQRGIVIYNVASKEEAIALSKLDPAIATGRLKAEFYLWWSAKGSTLK